MKLRVADAAEISTRFVFSPYSTSVLSYSACSLRSTINFPPTAGFKSGACSYLTSIACASNQASLSILLERCRYYPWDDGDFLQTTEPKRTSGKTLRDILEALPREWISEDLMEALMNRGVHLSPTILEVGDWVKFIGTITAPTYGWQGARPKSIGFVQMFEQHTGLDPVSEEVNVNELEDIKWEEDNNDREEKFEAMYEVDDENDDGDLADNLMGENKANAIVN
ncbi:E3 ubiquitin-protein ligase KEG [Arachis hypogaea]|nr:E3 ubiquitin-protein ligase KEG [Arachis hypogaea]